ncbi:MAG: hypothetical protein ACLGH8_02115 [Bacteroidia bacterium]
MSNFIKHKILETFYRHKREKSLEPSDYLQTPLKFCLSLEQLHDSLNYKTHDISIICEYFSQLGFLKKFTYKQEPHIQRYMITPEGEYAFYSKEFLKKLWYRDTRFVTPLAVSIGVFLFQSGLSIYNIPKLNKIERLEKEVDSLKQILTPKIEKLPK